MKAFCKRLNLPIIALVAGIVTALFRLWFFSLGTDERGLFFSGNFPDVMSWIVVAIAMALLFLGTRPLGGMKKYEENFSASTVSAIGLVVTAAGLCISLFAEFSQCVEPTQTAAVVLGFAAAVAFLLLSWCRYIGSVPNVLLHTVVGVFLILYLISHYRLWSSYPQLQTYAFDLIAIVFIMLACYQRAAFALNVSNRRAYAFFTLGALFFSLAALPGSTNPLFFLSGAVWMLCTICKLEPGEDEKEEESEEITEEQE